MKYPWMWKIFLVPAFLLLVFGLIGMLFPDAYMGFYLSHTAQTTAEELTAGQPKLVLLLHILFRANGVGMTMSGILAIFILVCAFRKGEKWPVPALAVAGGIGLLGEIVLEIMALN